MITELALATALSMTGTAFGHSFNYEFLPTKSFYEAQISVDPTTGTQAGWLGFENFTPNLVQVGWLSYGGNLTAFYQVWANGVITDTGTLGPELTPGSVIDVAVTVQPYQPGPLYVGNIVPYNMSATGTVSATHVNATPNTSVTLTPAAQPLVSGTVYQNLTGGPVQVMQPITGAVAGTAQIALGPSSSPPDFGAAETILLNSTKNISFVVPNGWYCSITASGETFGTTQLIGL